MSKEQINIMVKEGTKEKLQKISSIKSLQEGKCISYIDLIKRYIDELILNSGSIEAEIILKDKR